MTQFSKYIRRPSPLYSKNLTAPYGGKQDPLMQAIEKQMVMFGGHFDEMGLLCRWLVDSDEDDEDSWTQIRPY